jgi:hypothetical protein
MFKPGEGPVEGTPAEPESNVKDSEKPSEK